MLAVCMFVIVHLSLKISCNFVTQGVQHIHMPPNQDQLI